MIETVRKFILPAAYSVLPLRMQTPEATALLFAIGLQESRFTARRQVGGPAHGFWQFERGGGVAGVVLHPLTKTLALNALRELEYTNWKTSDDVIALVYDELPSNDVLAAVFARLLLYTDPKALPAEVLGPQAGWLAYSRNWRPGKPHRETWDKFWAQGWALAKAT